MPAGSRPGWRSCSPPGSRRSHGPVPSAVLRHYHQRWPQLMVTLAVGGPQDLDHGSGLSVGAGPGPDRVVSGRVEDRAQVVAAGEAQPLQDAGRLIPDRPDRKSTRLNSSHDQISYAVFCLKKKNKQQFITLTQKKKKIKTKTTT